MGKNCRKIYNFDDPAEFGDDDTMKHMVDDQPIGTSHGIHEGGDFMQDVTHEDAPGNSFGVGFGNPSSIMTMLKNIQLRQDERYEEDCRR